MSSNIFIAGFSGTGKTTTGRLVAARLGWRYVDTDDEIVAVAGKPIDAIFREDGEPRFRQLERESLARVCQGDRQVVSTGGGIVMDESNRRLMESAGVIVCLEATPETIYQRLADEGAGPESAVVRPMLDDVDPLGRIVALKSERQPSYALAHWTVHTDGLRPEDAADQVVRAWTTLTRRQAARRPTEQNDLAATVRTSTGEYPIWVGWGTLGELGQRVRDVLSPGAAYVITDDGARRHARRVQVSLEAADIPAHMFIVPQGETSKSLEMAGHLYGWLAGRRAERGHLIVAVGGGVVGDLAGYVAATFLRSVSFGQVPTTLLGMMDSSIGGKTGLDLPQGKNLVGAFFQPRFVLSDVSALQTLPQRELTSGWAEAIKHGLILDEELLRTFEQEGAAIASLDQEISTDVIRRSAAIKADVVSRDERDDMGVRVLLNYGHTIGHAIEAAAGYGRYLHGEAVSIGMMGAAMISNTMGMLSVEGVDRQRAVLEAFDLPVSFSGVDLAAVSEAMSVDKKMVSGAISWVLLEEPGRAVTRNDVPPEAVQDALRALQQ